MACAMTKSPVALGKESLAVAQEALPARNYAAQKRECLPRVLTHDLMILKRVA